MRGKGYTMTHGWHKSLSTWPHKRQRKLGLGPAHGTRVFLELQHPFPQAHVAAPVHARVDAEPSDRAVRKVVGVQIDRADCLPVRRQVAGLNQRADNAEQRTPNHVHLAEGHRHDVTVPATQWTEVRRENVCSPSACCAARTMPSTRTN